MLTILSFHDKANSVLKLIATLLIIGLVSCCKVPVPDGPRSAKPVDKDGPRTIDRSQLVKPVELESVSVYKMDEEMATLAGENFLRDADNPLVIEVLLVEQIDPTPRASSPAIVLNGQTLINTRLHPVGNGDKLVAFLPDHKLIKEGNTVAVVWLGNETLTLSKRPLTFKATDIAK
jgi:hypothetical protein